MWGCRSVAAVTIACLAVAAPAVAAPDPATQARLDRIERQLDARGLVEMLSRLDQLQRDVQQLHGDLEVYDHKLEEMQRRQRELYLDGDRRLQQLESRQPGVVPAAGAAPTPAPPAVSGSETPAAGDVPVGDQAAYEMAFSILKGGRYPEAAQAFTRFLAAYPGSSYTDNASYWLGETYYVTRDFDKALTVFSKLVEAYPQSPKLPDAQLKIAYIHYEKKNWAAAREELNHLVSSYPETTVARLAKDRLQRMNKEGH